MRHTVLFIGAALSAFVISAPMRAAEAAKPIRTAALEAGSVQAPKAGAPEKKTVVKKKKARPATRLVAQIDLSNQRMKVLVDGKVKHSWKISSGKRGHYTPTGSYKPYYITRMHYSRKYDNAPMPHSVFFRGGYAIHATGATGRLGTPASHGCIRLHPSNARTFYNLVLRYKKAGTAVRVTGSTPAYKARTRTARKVRRNRSRRNNWSNFNNYSNRYTGYRKPRRGAMRTRRVSSSRILHTWW